MTWSVPLGQIGQQRAKDPIAESASETNSMFK